MKLERIILDTDIGFDADDALALGFLLRSPDVKIEAVTTVYEFTELKKEIAKAIIAMSGSAHVDVYCGIDYRHPSDSSVGVVIPPEVIAHMKHPDSHEGRGLFSEDTIRTLKSTPPSDFAPERMRDIILSSPGEISIIAIGPMSNLGAMISLYPETVPCIKHIYAMSGMIDPARLNRTNAEYNIRADPAAAKRVYECGAPLTILPTDTTRTVWLQPEETALLSGGDTLCRTLANLSRIWEESNAGRTYMHDTLTAAYPLLGGMFTSRPHSASIDACTGHMKLWPDPASHIDVCLSVERKLFMDEFFARLGVR